MGGKKPERRVRWSRNKPSNNDNMGNWNREADREANRRERFIIAENKKKEKSYNKPGTRKFVHGLAKPTEKGNDESNFYKNWRNRI